MPRISANDVRWIIQVLEHTLNNPAYATDAQQLRAICDRLSCRLEQCQQAEHRANAGRGRRKVTTELS